MNHLNHELKLIVEGSGISLYSNTSPHANVLWAWSVDDAKTLPTLCNKLVRRLLRFKLEISQLERLSHYIMNHLNHELKLMVEGSRIS